MIVNHLWIHIYRIIYYEAEHVGGSKVAKVQREAVLLETASVAAAAVDVSFAAPWIRTAKSHPKRTWREKRTKKQSWRTWFDYKII